MENNKLPDNPGDIYFYIGGIDRDGYNKITDLLESNYEKTNNCTLSLSTYGGDPAAAYRIARAFKHHYNYVTIVIAGQCKSAGTLLSIGADHLVFGDKGELGPLDIQLSKPDELFENMSGLDILQAHNDLSQKIFENFISYLIRTRGSLRMKTQTACEIARELASDTIRPIIEKIDPAMMGEHLRAMQIANDYGDRLNKMSNNLKNNNVLNRLISSYPAHGFVIDRREAREDLFNRVDRPTGSYEAIYSFSQFLLNNLGEKSLSGTSIIIDQNNEIFIDFLSNLPDNSSLNIGESDKLGEQNESEMPDNKGNDHEEFPGRKQNPTPEEEPLASDDARDARGKTEYE